MIKACAPLELARGVGDELPAAALQARVGGQLLPGHAVRERVAQHAHKQVRVQQPRACLLHVADRACAQAASIDRSDKEA